MSKNPEIKIKRDGTVEYRGGPIGSVMSYEPGFNCGTFWAYELFMPGGIGNKKQGAINTRKEAANALILAFQLSEATP